MGRQGTLNQKCAIKGIKQTPHSNKTKSMERRGGKDSMSETRIGNDGREIVDRKGGRQNNRWQWKSKLIDRRVNGRWIIKDQKQEERWQRNLSVNRSAKGRKVVVIHIREEFNHQEKTRRGSNNFIDIKKSTREDYNQLF